jgi:hypothetical protein
MKPFEDELKNALRHVEPPAGFAQRVMERAMNEARSKPSVADRLRELFLPKPVRWAAAMGFVCLVIVVGAVRYRDTQKEKMQGEIASAQARLALQIASTKLNAVFRDAARSSRRHLEN